MSVVAAGGGDSHGMWGRSRVKLAGEESAKRRLPKVPQAAAWHLVRTDICTKSGRSPREGSGCGGEAGPGAQASSKLGNGINRLLACLRHVTLVPPLPAPRSRPAGPGLRPATSRPVGRSGGWLASSRWRTVVPPVTGSEKSSAGGVAAKAPGACELTPRPRSPSSAGRSALRGGATRSAVAPRGRKLKSNSLDATGKSAR